MQQLLPGQRVLSETARAKSLNLACAMEDIPRISPFLTYPDWYFVNHSSLAMKIGRW
jgi:hypothetical protein